MAMQNPGPGASKLERSAYLRSMGEQGWSRGWQPLNYADQRAYLEDIQYDISIITAEHLQHPSRVQPDAEDPMYSTLWLNELRERQLELEYILILLAENLDEDGNFTREAALAAEAEYAAAFPYRQRQNS